MTLSFFLFAHTLMPKFIFQSALRPSISIRIGTNTEEH
jgi:hypothetical protein